MRCRCGDRAFVQKICLACDRGLICRYCRQTREFHLGDKCLFDTTRFTISDMSTAKLLRVISEMYRRGTVKLALNYIHHYRRETEVLRRYLSTVEVIHFICSGFPVFADTSKVAGEEPATDIRVHEVWRNEYGSPDERELKLVVSSRTRGWLREDISADLLCNYRLLPELASLKTKQPRQHRVRYYKPYRRGARIE